MTHPELIASLLAGSAHYRRVYENDPVWRKAWADPDTDYSQIAIPDPRLIGRHDDVLEIIGADINVELKIAWQRILDAVRRGQPLREAVQVWGIRGHPDFADWFPATPGPWGDGKLLAEVNAG